MGSSNGSSSPLTLYQAIIVVASIGAVTALGIVGTLNGEATGVLLASIVAFVTGAGVVHNGMAGSMSSLSSRVDAGATAGALTDAIADALARQVDRTSAAVATIAAETPPPPAPTTAPVPIPPPETPAPPSPSSPTPAAPA